MTKIATIWGTHADLKDPPFSTHHSFWDKTLQDIPEIEHTRFTWQDLNHLPSGYDLYLFLDFNPVLFNLDRTDYDHIHPRAFYWWDSFHFTFVYIMQICQLFDKNYFAELTTTRGLSASGISVTWLPPAFYPRLYTKLNLEKQYDVSFVGQLNNVVRRNKITRLDLAVSIAGKFKSLITKNIIGDPVNQQYNESRILFDRSICYNIGTRFFETVGSGGFLLRNTVPIDNGIEVLAQEGQHYVSYDDTLEDCLEKIEYYLINDKIRERIAIEGYEYFKKNHTYKHRLDKILKDFDLI